MFTVHGAADGQSISAIRVTNNQAGRYGLRSFEIGVNASGALKVRLRVTDPDTQDENGYNKTKWSSWYTFTPDQYSTN